MSQLRWRENLECQQQVRLHLCLLLLRPLATISGSCLLDSVQLKYKSPRNPSQPGPCKKQIRLPISFAPRIRLRCNSLDLIEAFVEGGTLQILRRTQNCGNRNGPFIFSVIIASYRHSHRSVEEVGLHLKAGCLCLLNQWGAYCPRRIRVVYDERAAAANTVADQRGLALRGSQEITAYVFMRSRKMSVEVARFTRSLQTSEDYGLRHFSNLGGRTPRNNAP